MRLLILLLAVCPVFAQDVEVRIPPIKTAVALEGHPVQISAWGIVKPAPAGVFHLAFTVDLADLQANLTPVMAAQLNKSDRCGERLSVDKADLAPAPDGGGLLTAHVHYERYACVKAFGKEMVRRLVGGNAVVEVALAPSIGDNRIALAAQVRKIDADGSLGEMLRSGSFGDSLRQKIAASIENAVRKSANLENSLPPQVRQVATLESARFADGGSGRLWLALAANLRLTPVQFHALAQMSGVVR